MEKDGFFLDEGIPEVTSFFSHEREWYMAPQWLSWQSG
jgi:hypothetical protein